MPESPRHEFADLGDVRLHYLFAGKGPAVVLLHGWPQTSHMWRDVIPRANSVWSNRCKALIL